MQAVLTWETVYLLGDSGRLASEALVFIIVSLKKQFKCPIAYFMIDKISSRSALYTSDGSII